MYVITLLAPWLVRFPPKIIQKPPFMTHGQGGLLVTDSRDHTAGLLALKLVNALKGTQLTCFYCSFVTNRSTDLPLLV